MARLKEFGDTVKTLFGRNLAAEPGITEKRAAAEEAPFKQTVSFLSPVPVRYVVLQEEITKGQLIESVDITLLRQNGEEIKRTITTIGAKRIVKIPVPDAVSIVAEVKEFRGPPRFTLSVF